MPDGSAGGERRRRGDRQGLAPGRGAPPVPGRGPGPGARRRAGRPGHRAARGPAAPGGGPKGRRAGGPTRPACPCATCRSGPASGPRGKAARPWPPVARYCSWPRGAAACHGGGYGGGCRAGRDRPRRAAGPAAPRGRDRPSRHPACLPGQRTRAPRPGTGWGHPTASSRRPCGCGPAAVRGPAPGRGLAGEGPARALVARDPGLPSLDPSGTARSHFPGARGPGEDRSTGGARGRACGPGLRGSSSGRGGSGSRRGGSGSRRGGLWSPGP